MTAALEGGEWSAARPGRTLPPGKTRYPFYRILGGPQGRSGRAENLVPTGIQSRTVQPAVSRYTDWATRPTQQMVVFVCTNHVACNKEWHVLRTAWAKKLPYHRLSKNETSLEEWVKLNVLLEKNTPYVRFVDNLGLPYGVISSVAADTNGTV